MVAEVIDDLLLRPREVVKGDGGGELFSKVVAEPIEIGSLIIDIRHNGVARGVVEDNDVVQLDRPKTFDAAVFPLGLLDVGLAVQHRNRVLRQGQGKGSVGDTRSVAQLTDEEVVAREERFL